MGWSRPQLRLGLLSRPIQLLLLALLVHGVRVSWPRLTFNVGLALLATLLPALAERTMNVRIAGWLRPWVAAAALLHVIGIQFGLYGPESPFDFLTHTMMSMVVAAVGYRYATDRGASVVDDSFPNWAVVSLTLLVVLGAGIGWELAELGFEQLRYVNPQWRVIEQGGVEDAFFDLTFDVVGGLVFLLVRAATYARSDRPDARSVR